MSKQKQSTGEFVTLMALLMSLVALSIDSMLPALSTIAKDYNIQNSNSAQLIILVFFVGISIGQLFFGPYSDTNGRKKAIYMGVGLYLIGCTVSLLAPTFFILICGRFLQGIGVASCRVISQAIIRDLYEGRSMARIMSIIMTIFILVPALAPSIGQGILVLFNWHAIFILLMVMSCICTVWLYFRLDETLPIAKRLPFNMTQWFKGLKLVFFNPISLGYTLASAFIFGSLISYISTAQQVFQVLYNKGAQFPIYFGCLALTVGLASLVNAKFVMTFGMNYLIKRALNTFASGSILFFIFSYFRNSPPPFWLLMTFLGTMFFCVGMLFGNFNTLALEPHGKIAGMASAMIGSVQTFISVALGGVIGQSYNGTVIPLVGGFMVLGILAYISVSLAEKTRTIITST